MTTSLVERSQEVAVMVHASTAVIDNSLVRATQPLDGRFGRAFTVQRDATSTSDATLSLSRSNVEGGHDGGVTGFAATLDIEHVTVRDVAANLDQGIRGYGVTAQHHPGDGTRGRLRLAHALVERCHEAGVSVVSSDFDIHGLVAREGRHVTPAIDALPPEFGGRGLNLQHDPSTPLGATGTIRASLIDANEESGIVVEGSTLELIHSVVQHTRSLDPHYGRGIVVQDRGPARGSAVVRASELVANTEVGLFVVGSDVTLHRSLIRDTAPRPDGDLGVGVSVEQRFETARRSSFTAEDSVIAGSRVMGVGVVSSDITLLHTLVGQTSAFEGQFGDGVVALAFHGDPATATIADALITTSARAGVASFGSDVTISATRFDCNAIHLDREPLAGRDAAFSDAGDNICGCNGAAVPCQALSSSLEPPEPPGI